MVENSLRVQPVDVSLYLLLHTVHCVERVTSLNVHTLQLLGHSEMHYRLNAELTSPTHFICVFVCVCVCIYIYIYIYM